MSIHYKFKSSLDYDTVTFDGLHMTVGELKRSITQQKKIGRSADFELQITNAQTKEVYNDDEALVPKNSSVVVSRIPTGNSGKKWDRSDSPLMHSMANDNHEPLGYDKVAKSADLTTINVPEDEKIRAMMSQSTQDYDPSRYVKQRSMTGPIPPTYLCFRCGRPGHWIKNCPTNSIEVKRSTGIPRSFMVAVDGPDVPGALLTSSGQFAVPVIDHEAYKEGKKERPPFAKEPTPEKEILPEIPEELQCMICRDLLVDAVLIPCCGNSYCDECVRQTLLDSEEHECPTCHEKDISPDTLIPNRFLRTAVMSFKNETGYTKVKKAVAATEADVTERQVSPPSPSAAATSTSTSTPPPQQQQQQMLPISYHQPIVLSMKTQFADAQMPASDPPLQLQASPLAEDDRPDTPVTDERPHDEREDEARKESKSPARDAQQSPSHDAENQQLETSFAISTISTITTRGPGCVMPPLSPGYPAPKPSRPKTREGGVGVGVGGGPGVPVARDLPLPPPAPSHRLNAQRYDSPPPPHHRDTREPLYMKAPCTYGQPPHYSHHHPPPGQHHAAPLPPSHHHHHHLPPQHYPARSGMAHSYVAQQQQPPPPMNHSGILQGPPSLPPVMGHQPPPPGLAPLPPRPLYGAPPPIHGHAHGDPYQHQHHQAQGHHAAALAHQRPHAQMHVGPPHAHHGAVMAPHHAHQMYAAPPVPMHKETDYYALHRGYLDRSHGAYDAMDNFARELFSYHRRDELANVPPVIVGQGQSPIGHHGSLAGGARPRRPRSTSRSPYSSRSSYRSRSRSRTHTRSRSTSRSRSRSRRRPASRSRSFSYSSHSRSRSRSRSVRSRSRSFSASSRSRSHSSGRYAKSRSRSPRSRARHYSPSSYRRSRSRHHHQRREFGNRGQGSAQPQSGMLPLPVVTNMFAVPQPERTQRPSAYQDFRYGAAPNPAQMPNSNYRYPGELSYDGRYDQRYPPYPNRADNYHNPNDARHHRSWSPNTTPLNANAMPLMPNNRDDQRARPRSSGDARRNQRASSRSPVPPRQNSPSPSPASASATSSSRAPASDSREQSTKGKDGHHYRRSGNKERREVAAQDAKRDEAKSHAKKSDRAAKGEEAEVSKTSDKEKSKGHAASGSSSDKGLGPTAAAAAGTAQIPKGKDKEKKHKHRSSKATDTGKSSKKKTAKKSSSSADEVSSGAVERKKKRKKDREPEQGPVDAKPKETLASLQELEPSAQEELSAKEVKEEKAENDNVAEAITDAAPEEEALPLSETIKDDGPSEPMKVLPEGFQRTFVEVIAQLQPKEPKQEAVTVATLYDDLPPESATRSFAPQDNYEMDAEDDGTGDEPNENVLTAPVPELSKWELEETETDGGPSSPNQRTETAGPGSTAASNRVAANENSRSSGTGTALPPDIVQRAEKVIFHKALSAALGPNLMPRPLATMKTGDVEDAKRGSAFNSREKEKEKQKEKEYQRQREKEKSEQRTTSRDRDREKEKEKEKEKEEKDEKDTKDGKIKLDRSKFHGKMEVTIGSSNRKVSLKQEDAVTGATTSEDGLQMKATDKEKEKEKDRERERDWRIAEEKKHERKSDTKTESSRHRRDNETVGSEKSSRDSGKKPATSSSRRSRSRSRSKTHNVSSSRRPDQEDKDRQDKDRQDKDRQDKDRQDRCARDKDKDKPKPSEQDHKDRRDTAAAKPSRARSRSRDRSRKRDERKDSPKRARVVAVGQSEDVARDRRKSVLDESKFEPDYDYVGEAGVDNVGGSGGGGGHAKGTKRTRSVSEDRAVKMVRRDSEKSGTASVSGSESTSSSNSSSDDAQSKKRAAAAVAAAAAAKSKAKKNKHKKHKKHKHKHKKKKSHKKKDEATSAEAAKTKS